MDRRVPLFLTALLSLGFFSPYHAVVTDAVTGQTAAGFHLRFPLSYTALAPFCSGADLLTLLSLKQMMVFLPLLFALMMINVVRS